MTEYKFKVGDKVNPNSTYIDFTNDKDFAIWNGSTIIEILADDHHFPYRCVCDHYGPNEPGLFAEVELELA